LKKKILSVLLALVLVLSFSLVTAVPAGAATINVSPSGSIQAAINAASDGDIINVAAGTYTENVDVNKRVILQAVGAVTVNPAVSTDHIFHVTASHVTIDGFTLVGDSLEPTSRGILLDSGVTGCTITNNNYSRTNAEDAIAIYLDSADSNIVQSNTLTFSAGGTGISVQSSDHNLVKNNTVTLPGVGQAIWVDSSSHNLVQGNTLNNTLGLVSNAAPSTGNTIKGNTISNTTIGMRIVASFTLPVSDTTVIGNILTGCGNGIQITSDGAALSNLTITKNIFQSGTSAAIAVVKAPAGSSITISNNDVSSNTAGIYIGADADATLVTAGPNNSIVNNTSYAAKNLSSQSLNAQSNWWGTTDTSAIEAMLVQTGAAIDYSNYLPTAPASVGMTAEPVILPTVATSAASAVDFTTATLNGDLTAMGTATSVDVWFEWGTETSYGQTTPFETKTGIATFTAGLTGLTENTDYHFRAMARSADGTTTGADVTLHTIKAPAVTTLAATNVDLYSATLNGNLTDLGSATSVGLSFEWKISGGTYAEVAATPASATTVSTAFTYNLSGLTHNTTYYFRAKAVGDSTVYGAELSFTTVAERVGISVSPTSIDFGSILAGQQSATKTVTVTNEGNIVENFSASLSAESLAGFYAANLKIDTPPVTVALWSATSVAVDGTSTPGLVLSIPVDVTAGTKTATITFIAEKQ